jgi:hypothetical protein
MTDNKPKQRVEDNKVSTSVEFTIAVYRDLKDRGFEPELALRLTHIAVLDLRLYDIMKSCDTIADEMAEHR